MADHSKPTTLSLYADFVTELDGRFDDLAVGLDPAFSSPTNLPTNSIRFSSSLGRWQKWDGSAWGELADTYKLTQVATTGNVRIGSSSVSANVNLNVNKNVTGGTSAFGINSEGQVQSDVTTAAYMFRAVTSVAAGFTLPALYYYTTAQGTFSGTVTNQYGYAVSPSMTGGASGNFGFWSGLAADGTKNWAFYGSGTAPSYFGGSTTFADATSPIVSSKIGPTAAQQHDIPGVSSDTLALLAAAQTLTNKTISGVSNTITVDGTNGIGFRNIPVNSQSAAYTLVLSDSGKQILHPSADTTARVFTIPANSSVAFPIGTAVTFINQNGAGAVTISITTDTMRLAGTGATGNRTLAANGVATAVKITSTEWIISGTNLT